MFNLLEQKYNRISTLQGKALLRFIAGVFVVFLILGSVIGYFTSSKLNKAEVSAPQEVSNALGAYKTYNGIVTFIGKSSFPEDNIEYMLTDPEGKDIILLRAADAKLSIAEGLNVSITGKLVRTKNGKNDVLQVTEVTLKNGSN